MSLDLFDRPGHGERAILVGVDFGPDHRSRLAEFRELAASAGASILVVMETRRDVPDPRFFVGTGKVSEIEERVRAEQAELVLFNHELSASQERNLEQRLKCRVLDRTGLILDIFAQRARSFEGKLQVELAQLRHLSTRLVRGWTHLERQKGGIGLRGPGETQLESDRRLIGRRINQLQKRLDKVDSQRRQSRRGRERAEIPTVSLVGYTNAGKSTLFNRLTGAGVFTEDQLFATLDPTVRRMDLPDAGAVILADTVGFVRDLPHDLVAAFRSTLLETREADLLLHIVDSNDEERLFRQEQVDAVLEEVGAADVPQIIVYNKIDVDQRPAAVVRDAEGGIHSVSVSAHTGEGLDLLAGVMAEFFSRHFCQGWIRLEPAEGRARAKLYDCAQILAEEHGADGSQYLHIRVARDRLGRLGIDPQRLVQRRESDPLVAAAR